VANDVGPSWFFGPFFLVEPLPAEPRYNSGTIADSSRWLPMAKPIQYQIISRALAILADEGRWTKGALARRASGDPCPCFDPAAASFCAAGALYRAACELRGSNSWVLAQEAEKQVLMANGWASMSLPDINDREGHTRIVELFKKAMGVLPNAYPSRPGAWVMKTQVSQ
jgi:hypothetical protein